MYNICTIIYSLDQKAETTRTCQTSKGRTAIQKLSCAITNRDIDMSLTYESVGDLWKATIQFTIYPADLVPSMDVNIIYGTIHRNSLISRDKRYW